MKNDLIKEPHPDQKATASYSSTISQQKLTSSGKRIQKKDLRKRLIGGWAVPVPDWLLEPRHLKKIKSALPTLMILMRSCEGATGTWKGTEEQIADWLNVTSRTVRNHLTILKSELGVTKSQSANGIFVHLPDKLNPFLIVKQIAKDKRERTRKKLSSGRKNFSKQTERNFTRAGNNVPEPQKLGDSW